ncbi:OmpA family protein [Kaarinaea lacus]
MATRITLLVLYFMLLTLSACSSNMNLSMDQLREQYPKLAQLESDLDNAKANGSDLLAPESYKIALNAYIEAFAAAQSGNQHAAVQYADNGISALKKALQTAETSKTILQEVLAARNRAHKAGADKFYQQKMNELDTELSKIGKLIDNGNINKAKQRRPELQKAYLDLELEALKQSTIEGAQAAIAQARNNEAHKYAPKTFANAQEQLTLAQSVLEVDRTSREKANEHAYRSTVAANRSNYIAAVVKDIKRGKLSEEDIVLAYQSQLNKLSQAMGYELLFDKPNEQTLEEFRKNIVAMVNDKSEDKQRVLDLEAQLAQLQEEHHSQTTALKVQHAQAMANLEAKLGGEISMMGRTQEHLERMVEEQRARFERVQSMFNDREANVYRQKNNVLISVHGFKFPVGSAEIRPDNFALLNKVVKAINEFKGSRIMVSGHTDSTGKASQNKTLSDQRAKNVAKFLTEVGKISSKRISAKGYGQEKPIASNQTAKGRAQNRRVEILIINN